LTVFYKPRLGSSIRAEQEEGGKSLFDLITVVPETKVQLTKRLFDLRNQFSGLSLRKNRNISSGFKGMGIDLHVWSRNRDIFQYSPLGTIEQLIGDMAKSEVARKHLILRRYAVSHS
jgi:hypothetical protein